MNIEIKKRIDSLANEEATRLFFDLLHSLIKYCEISETDERLALNVRNDYRKRISVNINGRLVLYIIDGGQLGFMLESKDIDAFDPSIKILEKEDFANSGATLIKLSLEDVVNNREVLEPFWLNSCKDYLPSQNKSQYRIHHRPELYQMANDEVLLNDYISSEENHYTNFIQFKDEFIEYLKREDNKLSAFRITKVSKANSFFWIGDHQGIIGSLAAHYELLLKGKSIKLNLDFESSSNRDLFHKTIDTLPQPLEWFKWSKSKSIQYSEAFDLDDENILEKLSKALLHMDNSVGDQVREIIEKKDIFMSANQDSKLPLPLNQILYGPPGTGKTYHTINKSIELIEPQFDLKQDRKIIKQKYEDLVKTGQIVFTTFHQSMCYEDFIEGIKPLKPEENDSYLKYEVEPGVFKLLCDKAKTPNSNSFSKAYDNLRKELSDRELIDLKTPTGKSFSISLNSNGNLSLHTGETRDKQGVLTYDKLMKQINGEDMFKGWDGYFKGVIDYLKEHHGYNSMQVSKVQNYVLIIDEINRGNVSQIFGELITLLEEDKRLGKAESLEVTLPYSKEKFGVPPNLYIIGTMNTADRSVEALDAALRRRFSFTEMPPVPDLIKTDGKAPGGMIGDIDLANVLSIINKRIELLLDKDHQIGHSYFLSVENEEDLKAAFKNKIIPLLQEYFFGDYGKIGLVLGSGFIEVKQGEKNVFAKFDDSYEAADFEERKLYHMIPINEGFDIKIAIEKLLNN